MTRRISQQTFEWGSDPNEIKFYTHGHFVIKNDANKYVWLGKYKFFPTWWVIVTDKTRYDSVCILPAGDCITKEKMRAGLDAMPKAFEFETLQEAALAAEVICLLEFGEPVTLRVRGKNVADLV